MKAGLEEANLDLGVVPTKHRTRHGVMKPRSASGE